MPDPQSNEPIIVPVSQAEALEAVGEITMSNELAVAVALLSCLQQGFVGDLDKLVTPETLPKWIDDLAVIRQAVADCNITSRVEYAAPHVAYVKAVHGLSTAGPGMVLADAVVRAEIITLVFREEFGGWRAHGIGAPVPPDRIAPA